MRDDLVSWANAKYREFAVKMLDVLPDFPNCCYQVSGAATMLALGAYLLTDVKVVYGGYEDDGVVLPHGWVRAHTRAGQTVILDFAHLQFEHDKLYPGCCSYHQLVRERVMNGLPVPGSVIFFPEDAEYGRYKEES